MINDNEIKPYSTVTEAVNIIGVTPAYIRDILNRSKVDHSIRLIGTKLGREWRIDTQSIYDYLGIDNRSGYKKDMYIKELEQQIQIYKAQNDLYKDKLNMISKMCSMRL